MLDNHGRNIDYLRISVTDRCNLRCIYCMPQGGVEWLPHESILTFEEITRLCRLFAELGIRKIKLTGGEPLVRQNIVELVSEIKHIPGIEQVTMTTNGVLFAPLAASLRQAGLDAVTFSLDTLDRDRYAAITRGDHLGETLASLHAALTLGMRVKLNCVPVRGQNENELPALAALARDNPIQVRFIEMMPIGCGKGFTSIPFVEIKAQLEAAYGESVPCKEELGNGPADYFTFAGFKGHIGFITAMTHPFCDHCNRIRLTSSGYLKLCLHHPDGISLLAPLREGRSDTELLALLRQVIPQKPAHHNFENARTESGAPGMNAIGG